MDLKLNNSELMTILNVFERELNEDNLFDFEIATVKTILKKINDNVQFKHHNAVEEYVLEIRENYLDVKAI